MRDVKPKSRGSNRKGKGEGGVFLIVILRIAKKENTAMEGVAGRRGYQGTRKVLRKEQNSFKKGVHSHRRGVTNKKERVYRPKREK